MFKNQMFKLDIENQIWVRLEGNGTVPEGRVDHEIRAINNNKLVIIGGIQGLLNNIDRVFNDIHIFNISIPPLIF
jgi:hypothetical protein